MPREVFRWTTRISPPPSGWVSPSLPAHFHRRLVEPGRDGYRWASSVATPSDPDDPWNRFPGRLRRRPPLLAGAEIERQLMRRHLRASLVIGAIELCRPVRGGLRRRVLRPRLDPPGGRDRGAPPVDHFGRCRVRREIESRPPGARQAHPRRVLRRPRDRPVPRAPVRQREPAARRLRRGTALAILIVPRLTKLVHRVPDRVSEPEVNFLFLVLFLLGGLAELPERGRPAGLPHRPRGGRCVRRRPRRR